MKFALAVLMALLFAGVAQADSNPPDIIVQVNGALTTCQGEAFAFSYDLDLTGYHAPYGLVPGTLTYSSSGPLGTFTALGVVPEEADWQDSAGDDLNLLLFRSLCTAADGWECMPEVQPNDAFPPGTTNAELSAFADGILQLTPAHQSGFESYFGDVKVSFVSVPEPSTYAMLIAGIVGLLALRRHRIGAEDAEG
jgi:hypothetical protein